MVRREQEAGTARALVLESKTKLVDELRDLDLSPNELDAVAWLFSFERRTAIEGLRSIISKARTHGFAQGVSA